MVTFVLCATSVRAAATESIQRCRPVDGDLNSRLVNLALQHRVACRKKYSEVFLARLHGFWIRCGVCYGLALLFWLTATMQHGARHLYERAPPHLALL